jgi:TPR repeat protein
MECYLNVISCQDNIDWLKSQLGPLFESEIIDMLYLDKECLVGAAEHRIAMIYLDGNGVEKNPKTALGWLKKSSDLKCWHGRYTLGYILAKGAYGIECDKEKAKQLLESLLDDNHSDCKSEKIRYALSLCE